jgi:hypothetical protein
VGIFFCKNKKRRHGQRHLCRDQYIFLYFPDYLPHPALRATVKQAIFITSLILFIVILQACSSGYCSIIPGPGNLGSTLNSKNDDYAPAQGIVPGTLVFNTNSPIYAGRQQGIREILVMSDNSSRGFFQLPSLWQENGLKLPVNAGSISFYQNPLTRNAEIFFAAPDQNNNVNIYTAKYIRGQWQEYKSVDECNTRFWDSQPVISADGSMLIFASDRPGGIGGMDLYICRRINGKNWSKPENLRSVNTRQDDYTPALAPDGTLFFASKGYSNATGFDILIADPIPQGFAAPRLLPAPINSAQDDIYPCWWADSLLLSSDRQGGCGGLDLYGFSLCGPVIARGRISASGSGEIPGGQIDVLEKGISIARTQVQPDGQFSVQVPARHMLTFRYTGPGYTDRAHIEYSAVMPCSETNALVVDVNLQLPDTLQVFTTEDSTFWNPLYYTVPFFVSGYYRLNTPENLGALRQKFSYGLFGNDDSTRYIQNPASVPEYEEYASVVDSAMKDAVKAIAEWIQNAGQGSDGRLNISVQGYADPRGISGPARYADEPISDEQFGLMVRRGEKMTNQLLASLRAYYTVLFLQEKLSTVPGYMALKQRIRWSATGAGIDNADDKNLELRRRVVISVVAESGKNF